MVKGKAKSRVDDNDNDNDNNDKDDNHHEDNEDMKGRVGVKEGEETSKTKPPRLPLLGDMG